MAQGRSTKIITMIQWIRTSRLSIKNSLSGRHPGYGTLAAKTDIKRGGSCQGLSAAADPKQLLKSVLRMIAGDPRSGIRRHFESLLSDKTYDPAVGNSAGT